VQRLLLSVQKFEVCLVAGHKMQYCGIISHMKEDAQFYVGQKAFIEKDGNVLVLFDPTEVLHLPGGKIQVGEFDFIEALKREVREETSLEIEVGKPFVTWYNIFPDHHRNAGKKVFLVGYRCKYKSGDIRLSDEHDSFKWVNGDDYKSLDDKSQYFSALSEYFNR
jgi:ADP-ribose pyrophosphatase YjhB (NUDIX family)